MRATLRALAIIASIDVTGVSGLSTTFAAPVGATPVNAAGQATLVQPVRWGGYCERLRLACKFKEYRDELGFGNCHRYRVQCLSRMSYCERLRRACIDKDYRGEVGLGNCRRYRYECGGY